MEIVVKEGRAYALKYVYKSNRVKSVDLQDTLNQYGAEVFQVLNPEINEFIVITRKVIDFVNPKDPQG
jgi:hypothetical protein